MLFGLPPRGRANLGIRGLADAAKALAAPDAGAIAPRWVLTGAPTVWVAAEASSWLTSHGFKESTSVSRVGPTSWCFNAWSDHADLGPKTFSSGIAVAPAQGRSRKRTAKATVAQAVWGAAPLAASAPVPAAKSSATAAPANGPSVVVSPVTGQAAGDAKTRERTRSPSPSKEPARSLLCLDLRCRMLPVSPLLRRAEKVTVLTRSVATGLARMSGTDATEADLKPGGRLQGYLRCEAAKWIRGHPELYGGSEAAARFPGCYHRCLGRHSVTLRAGSCAQSAAPCLLLCAYC